MKEHKGFMTAEEIFNSRAAVSRFETLAFSRVSPSTGAQDFAVIATDCPVVDVFATGGRTQVAPRDCISDLLPAELDNQLSMFQ